MTIEQNIQKYYIGVLQKAKIDFFRINNRAFGGKSSSPKSYGVWQNTGEPCTKYFPDLINLK